MRDLLHFIALVCTIILLWFIFSMIGEMRLSQEKQIKWYGEQMCPISQGKVDCVIFVH